MNRTMRMILLFGLAWVMLLSGCAAKIETSYYSLHVPLAASGGQAGDISATVGPITLPDILKQTRIATDGENGVFHLSEYHRWSGELDRDLGRALVERLSMELRTENVSLYPWDTHLSPTFRVVLDVIHMGGEIGREAALSVRWALVDQVGDRDPVIRRSDMREMLTGGGHSAWVAAQQRNVEKLGSEIAMAILERAE